MTQAACPVCGTELTMAQLFSNEETQRAVARLAAVSMPLGARVLQYCTLFAPAKTRLTVPKQVKIMLQLLPDLERRAITHKGREWAMPLDAWAAGFDQMLAMRDAGRLELPMSGHGYLYAILVGLADKQEGRAEAQLEAARRAPAQNHTLSQGQRHYLCLLAILLMQPATILLDEPLAGLDLPTQIRLQRRLAVLPQRLITISHDPAAVASCDRVIWLESGRIHADGPPAPVLQAFTAEMQRLGGQDADADLSG